MNPLFLEWLHLIVRWAHFIIGVAWIGASFYFNWLENHLNREKNLRPGVAGNLWAIHGGGFYYLEKYKVAPAELPKDLHWFKWEAYYTWVTGVMLLFIVYYFNASSYLVDPNVADITPRTAIMISIGVLPLGWIVYNLLCNHLLKKSQAAFNVVALSFVTFVAYALCHLLSARAAYIHVGAMLGTIMAANVFFVIIPFQKSLLKSASSTKQPDPTLVTRAFLRSRHNNYITLPVLFIMISNHFPSTYGHWLNWAILIGLTIIGSSVRHYFNIRHLPKPLHFIIPAALLGMIGLAYVSSQPLDKAVIMPVEGAKLASYQEFKQIIDNRCLSCHSKNPTDDIFKIAPNGVKFDSEEQVNQFLDRIHFRAVTTKTMPLANKTHMTQDERNLLGQWITKKKASASAVGRITERTEQ